MTDSPASTAPGDAQAAEATATETAAVPVAKRRPARKPSKPDAVLAAAVDTARNGVLEIAGGTPVGEHLGAFPEAERLVTHRFAAKVPGYVGWHWFATVARVPRGKDVTVCEVGLLPSADALLAPDWVPWSERVRPEDTVEESAGESSLEETPQEESGQVAAASDSDSDDAAADAGIVAEDIPAEVDPAAEDTSTSGGESPVA